MKHLKKILKEDEKKVISTRVRTVVLNAFQKASQVAEKEYGYRLSLSDVVETALKEAIDEFAVLEEKTYDDYLAKQLEKLQEEWGEERDENSRLRAISAQMERSIKSATDSLASSGIDMTKEIRLGVENYMKILYSGRYLGGPLDNFSQYLVETDGNPTAPSHFTWIEERDDWIDKTIEGDLDEGALVAKQLIGTLKAREKTSQMERRIKSVTDILAGSEIDVTKEIKFGVENYIKILYSGEYFYSKKYSEGEKNFFGDEETVSKSVLWNKERDDWLDKTIESGLDEGALIAKQLIDTVAPKIWTKIKA